MSTDDNESEPWWTDVVLPVLLDAGRRVYGRAIQHELAAAGFDDMPRRGARLVGGIARNGSGLTEFSRVLGTTKQAASQLVDTLVMRGYVERTPDAGDRRRMTVTLTDRGAEAAAAIRRAVDGVDAQLLDAVGPHDAQTMRRVIGTLTVVGGDPS